MRHTHTHDDLQRSACLCPHHPEAGVIACWVCVLVTLGNVLTEAGAHQTQGSPTCLVPPASFLWASPCLSLWRPPHPPSIYVGFWVSESLTCMANVKPPDLSLWPHDALCVSVPHNSIAEAQTEAPVASQMSPPTPAPSHPLSKSQNSCQVHSRPLAGDIIPGVLTSPCVILSVAPTGGRELNPSEVSSLRLASSPPHTLDSTGESLTSACPGLPLTIADVCGLPP